MCFFLRVVLGMHAVNFHSFMCMQVGILGEECVVDTTTPDMNPLLNHGSAKSSFSGQVLYPPRVRSVAVET